MAMAERDEAYVYTERGGILRASDYTIEVGHLPKGIDSDEMKLKLHEHVKKILHQYTDEESSRPIINIWDIKLVLANNESLHYTIQIFKLKEKVGLVVNG